MSAGSGFIWRKDYGNRLEKSVEHFNRQVYRMQKINPGANFIPAKVDYNQIKFSVNNKIQLDRIITRLNSLTAATAKPYRLPGGIVMTKWERKEIGKTGRRINMTLNAEHKTIMNLDMIAGMEKIPYKRKDLMPDANEAQYRHRNFNPDNVNPDDWQQFADRLEKQSSPDYIEKNYQQVQTNFFNAVYKVWGRQASDLLAKINSMDSKAFMKLINSNTLVDFDYVYRNTDDYDDRLDNLEEIFEV